MNVNAALKVAAGITELHNKLIASEAVVATQATMIDTQQAQIVALKKALGDIMPLLKGCDCIYSDETGTLLCPCNAARALLP